MNAWRERFAFVALALALSLAPALAACVGPTLIIQQYDGPPREQSTIAILRINGSEPVQLLSVDEGDARAPIASDSRLHVELLPGRHGVSVQLASNPYGAPDYVDFEAMAGKVYRVVYMAGERGPTAHVFEVARDTDAVGADVTLPPAPSQPRARLPKVMRDPAPPPPESAPTPVSDAGADATAE